MVGGKQEGFELDARLAADSQRITTLSLCEMRLMNERRWPWIVLVPRRADIEEIHELTPLDQTMLTFETNLVAQELKSLTNCTKLNVGALGNIVRQLHMHIIARNEGDTAWPGPVWGCGQREPYRDGDEQQLIDSFRSRL